MFIGTIEWDGSLSPTVIVGTTVAAVRRKAAERLVGNVDSEEPGITIPELSDSASDEEIAAWLDTVHEATTVPWFEIADDVVVAD